MEPKIFIFQVSNIYIWTQHILLGRIDTILGNTFKLFFKISYIACLIPQFRNISMPEGQF